MPNIIVEGPDGAGKSTLMDMFRERVKKKYFVMLRHSCRPYHPEDAVRFFRFLASADHQMKVLVDRHPMISEPIYGPILRGKNLLEGFDQLEMDYMIRTSCHAVIYCRPPRGTIIENLSKQPQLAGVYEKIDQLIAEYDATILKLERMRNIPVYFYDWTSPGSFDRLAQTVFGGDYAG